MAKHDRRVYAPPASPSRERGGYDPAPPGRMAGGYDRDDHDEPATRRVAMFAVLVFLVVGFGAIVWNLYDAGPRGGDLPRIAAPEQPFRTPGPDAEAPPAPLVEAPAAAAVLEMGPEPADAAEGAPADNPSDAATPASPPGPAEAAAPAFVADGPFVAQIAALQSERAIGPLWDRLAGRAPTLFANARMDVQRADLGPRGVYFRVRAGYFADRASASAFCARMRAMGQDCITVAR